MISLLVLVSDMTSHFVCTYGHIMERGRLWAYRFVCGWAYRVVVGHIGLGWAFSTFKSFSPHPTLGLPYLSWIMPSCVSRLFLCTHGYIYMGRVVGLSAFKSFSPHPTPICLGFICVSRVVYACVCICGGRMGGL